MGLYEAWQKTVAQQPRALALVMAKTGENWTFERLAALAEKMPRSGSPAQVLRLPERREIHFFTALLAAWRDSMPVFPCDGTLPGHLPEAAVLQGKRVCHLKLTSGSTGAARIICFTAEPLMADCAHVCSAMDLHPARPNIAAISLAHSYGFSNLVLPLLLRGVPLVMAPDALPASLECALHAVQTHFGTPATLPAVPAMWRAWQQAGLLKNGIHTAISAGAPLPLELETNIYSESGLKVHNFLGSSECGGIAYDALPTPRTDPRLAGTALPGVAVKVAESGCLEVHSAAVGLEAWSAGQFTPLGPQQGVFQTSDLASVLTDGQIHLLGRSGDGINIAGRKLHPLEMEQRLEAMSHVCHAVVFGIPSADASRGEEIVCLLNLKEADSLEIVQRALKLQLPSWQYPRHWRHVPTLRPDSRGKISRHYWRTYFLENR